MVVNKYAYTLLYRMQAIVSTATPAMIIMAADRITNASKVTTVAWGYISHSLHCGLQALSAQQKPSLQCVQPVTEGCRPEAEVEAKMEHNNIMVMVITCVHV